VLTALEVSEELRVVARLAVRSAAYAAAPASFRLPSKVKDPLRPGDRSSRRMERER
jgi:hypothetical protein